MRLGNDPTNEERAARNVAEAAHRRALDDFQKRKKRLMVLPGYGTG